MRKKKTIIRRFQASLQPLRAAWEETEKEIRHRLTDPGQYEKCRSKDVTDGVRMILCKKADGDSWEPQALRFDADKFNLAEAKKWMKDNWEKKSQQSLTAEELLKLPECLPLQLAADEESLDQKVQNVRSAFYEQQRKPVAMPGPEMYVRNVYDDHVIVDAGEDGLFEVDYSLDSEGKVTFADRKDWRQVKLEYIPVKATMSVQLARTEREDPDLPKGTSWDVTIIVAGVTKTNPPFYVPVEALHASVSVFEGAKVYAVLEGDRNGHKSDANKKVVREIVGALKDPYVDGNELRATLNILPSEKWLRDNLLFLASKAQLHVYQLSVDSIIATEKKHVEAAGKEMQVMQRILKADLDIVGEAAAGGKFNRLVASQQHQSSTGVAMGIKQKLIALFSLFYPSYLTEQNVDWLKVNENELYTHLMAADKAQPRLHLPEGMDEKLLDDRIQKYQAAAGRGAQTPPAAAPAQAGASGQDPPPAQDPNKQFQAALDPLQEQVKQLQLSNCSNLLKVKLAESKLPKHLQDGIEKRWKDKLFSEAEIDLDIKNIREMFAPFAQPGIDNRGMDVQAGPDQIEKMQAAVDAMFLTSQYCLDPVKKGTEEYTKLFAGQDPFRSIKELYVSLTGDVTVSGIAPRRMQASLVTSDWVNVISAAMNKRMARDYARMNLDTWRAFVELREGVNNFKEQQTVRYGGYPNLPIVAQRGPYLPLASPTDEKATWSPTKRGGTEDITREMVKNDDVSAIQRIPTRMTRAAAQTLHEFIYDFIRPSVNPAIYDGDALYHANHSNTGTAALGTDGVALAAARLRMRKQTEKDNSKALGLRAGLLFVPSDLEETGYKLLTPAAEKSNQVPAFLQQLGIIPVVVDYWTDVTDWVLGCRREDLTGLEVGFVDGQETPQVFVSDLPNVGSFFTNDAITFKIRHEYGGAINDFRAFDGSIVAG